MADGRESVTPPLTRKLAASIFVTLCKSAVPLLRRVTFEPERSTSELRFAVELSMVRLPFLSVVPAGKLEVPPLIRFKFAPSIATEPVAVSPAFDPLAVIEAPPLIVKAPVRSEASVKVIEPPEWITD